MMDSGLPINTSTNLGAGRRVFVATVSLGVMGALSAACVSAPVPQAEATNHASAGQPDPIAAFLTNYVAWAAGIEDDGQRRGTPLNARQQALAAEVGIEHPEKVRLVYAESVPFPTHDDAMRTVGESLGFTGPGIVNNAQAFGYSIWVREGFELDWPKLAHELVHVAQIERSESFGDYARRYVAQLQEFGHAAMPLEVEAYAANRKYGGAN